MARDIEDILHDINQNKNFNPRRFPDGTIGDAVREALPRLLRGENNDEFFKFIDKELSYIQALRIFEWILRGQFSVLTAKGRFLDNIGRWLGLSRPPLPVKRTNDPVVIFLPKKGLTEEEQLEWNLKHGITGKNEGDVKGTYFPSRDFIGETLVNDEEYRVYILSMLKLKKGGNIDTIIQIFAQILVRPFFINKRTPDVLEFIASNIEDSNRLVIIREMTARLRTTGYDIRMEQGTEEDMERIEAIYGKGCWEQKNPYLNDPDEEENTETPQGE